MSPKAIRERAQAWRNCGLPIDAGLLEALAHLYAVGQRFDDSHQWQVDHEAALKRVENITTTSIPERST